MHEIHCIAIHSMMTSRNGRSVVSLTMKTSMVCRTIGYNGVPRWYPNLKWGRQGLWWLDTRHGSEHNISRRVGKGEAGCFHQRQASRQLREFAQQARRRRRNGGVDLRSRCEEGAQGCCRCAFLQNRRIETPCHKKSNARYLTQHLCLLSLDYIVPSIEPGSFYP